MLDQKLQNLNSAEMSVYTFIRHYNLERKAAGRYPGCHPDTISQALGLPRREVDKILVRLALHSLIFKESVYWLIKELEDRP